LQVGSQLLIGTHLLRRPQVPIIAEPTASNTPTPTAGDESIQIGLLVPPLHVAAAAAIAAAQAAPA
jgi:hypothetical protein